MPVFVTTINNPRNDDTNDAYAYENQYQSPHQGGAAVFLIL